MVVRVDACKDTEVVVAAVEVMVMVAGVEVMLKHRQVKMSE